MARHAQTPQRGFTLVELVVSIAMLAILAALATPSFKRMIEAQRMRTGAFALISDLTLARSEAVKRGESVELMPVGGNWTGGWLVRVAATSETIGSQNQIGPGITLASAATSIRFNRNGQLDTVSRVRIAISDTLDGRRCITLDPSGRPKSTKSECPA